MNKQNIEESEYTEISRKDVIDKIFFESFLLPYQPYIFIVHVGFFLTIERELGRAITYWDLMLSGKKVIAISGKFSCAMNILLIADDDANPGEVIWYPVTLMDSVEYVPKMYKKVQFITKELGDSDE